MSISESTKNINAIITQVRKENYLLEVKNIKEIYIPGENVIPIPLADKSIVGVINIRDEIYTIISLRHKINPSEEDYGFSENSRILLSNHNGMKIAILVDSVVGVKEFSSSAFDTKNIIVETQIDWRFIKSVCIEDNQTFILLNMDSLVPKKQRRAQGNIISYKNALSLSTKAPQIPDNINPRPSSNNPSIQTSILSNASPRTTTKMSSTIPLKVATTKIDEYLVITPSQKDLLMEVGNIGTGNAVTALSKIIKKRIDIDITDVKILTFEKLSAEFGKPSIKVCGIFSHIEKPSQSTLLQIFDLVPMMHLVASIAGAETMIKPAMVKSKKDLDDFAISTIIELGNIMAGHYASALANLMGIKLIPDVPDFTMSESGTLGNFLSNELKRISKYLIMIKTRINVIDAKINGFFLFVPDMKSLEILFERLGIEYEGLTKTEKVIGKKPVLDLQKFVLTDQQKDALKEVGNIGSGNAANALAKMINQRVDINVPNVEIVVVDEFAERIGRKTGKLFISWSNVVGITRATVLTLFKLPDILNLISIIIDKEDKIDTRKIKKFDDIPEMYASAMTEVGHILGSHYTNALGNLLGVKLMTEPPDVNMDTGKHLFTILKNEIGLLQELSLVITTKVIVKKHEIEGSFLFIPDLNTLEGLLEALKKFY
ncbi:MAG: chemotaxis protein CheC [Promethearchaeota archaeon]